MSISNRTISTQSKAKVLTSKPTPESIIKEALEIGNKLSQEKLQNDNNNQTRKELIFEKVANTEETSRHLFVTNLSKRYISEVQKIFLEKINKCNTKAEKILQQTKIEVEQCKKEIDEMNQINFKLEDILIEINNRCKEIELKQKKKNEEINQLQTKFTIFERVRPLFEEIITSFPNEDPIHLIRDVKISKEKSVDTISKLNILQDKIDEKKKEQIELLSKNTKIQNDLDSKIREINLDHSIQKEKFTKELNFLKNELKIYKNYQIENEEFSGLLYEIYSQILSKIQKQAIIEVEKTHKPLMVTKDKFKPEIFDDIAFINLLNNTFLKNVSKGKEGILLRQTIAFANVMVRNYLSKKSNLRFDVVSTLHELKNLLDKKDLDNYKLKCIEDALKQNSQKNKKTIKELKSELKLAQLKFNALDMKAKRLSKARKMTSGNEENNNNAQREKDDQTEKRNTRYGRNKRFFITSQNLIKKKEDKMYKEKDKRNLSHPKWKGNNINPKTEEQKEVGTQEEYEYEDKSNNEFNKFKDIKVSKNRDKLIKSHGFSGMDSIIWGLKKIVEKTNRAYYYKSRVEKSLPKSQQVISAQNAPTQEETTEKNINVNKEDDNYDILSKRILHNLNNMIMEVKEPIVFHDINE